MAEPNATGSAHRSSHAGSANVPSRRLSYASVVTGAPANSLNNPVRPGAFAQNAAAMSSNSRLPQNQMDARIHGKGHGQEHDMSASPGHRRGPSSSSRNWTAAGSFTIPPFWVPAYLENSRYARKLEAVYNARVRALRDQDVNAGSFQGSIWARSSNARIAPSHRGMTYDIIESNPPPEDDILPLPTKLNSLDKHQGLDLLNDGLEVRYNGVNGKDLEAALVRSDYPMPPQCGICYYEITIKQKAKECAVAIGFSISDYSLERLPGWEQNSWAYHSDDGKVYDGTPSGHPYKIGYGAGDIVGCGVDFNKGHCFFTKNGQELGVAFRDISFPAKPIYPCIGTKKQSGVQIYVNFGQSPFVYDMKNKMSEEEEIVSRQISKKRTSSLHPRHPTETSFTQDLVAQFLSHGGYIETARAFAQQVQAEKQALSVEPSDLPELHQPNSSSARSRQDIRQAILRGNIDTALNKTEESFPEVLNHNPQIFFELRCRKFIELVHKAAEIDKSRSSILKSKQSSNGFGSHSPAVDDVFDQAMEVDDEQQSTNGNGKAPVQSELSDSPEYNELTAEALRYGRSLKEEFGDKDEATDKRLHDIFSLLPYRDPSPSQHGHLLDSTGRTKVAEDLNSVILASLGRAPNAALETIWHQTETLIELLSQEGGPASFVNLARDEDR